MIMVVIGAINYNDDSNVEKLKLLAFRNILKISFINLVSEILPSAVPKDDYYDYGCNLRRKL